MISALVKCFSSARMFKICEYDLISDRGISMCIYPSNITHIFIIISIFNPICLYMYEIAHSIDTRSRNLNSCSVAVLCNKAQHGKSRNYKNRALPSIETSKMIKNPGRVRSQEIEKSGVLLPL